jgi:hypothetical protein
MRLEEHGRVRAGFSGKANGRRRAARWGRVRPARLGAALSVAFVTGVVAAAASVVGASQQRATDRSPSRAAAKHQLLRLSDFPKGWRETAQTSSTNRATSSTSQLKKVAKCEGVSASGMGKSASATAVFRKSKSFEFVFESVAVFPSPASAAKAYGIFASPDARRCVGPALAKAIASGTGSVAAKSITTTRLAFPKEGSATTALGLRVPVTSTGHKIEMEADVVVIRGGKSLALLLPLSMAKGFPMSLARSLGSKAASRL